MDRNSESRNPNEGEMERGQLNEQTTSLSEKYQRNTVRPLTMNVGQEEGGSWATLRGFFYIFTGTQAPLHLSPELTQEPLSGHQYSICALHYTLHRAARRDL